MVRLCDQPVRRCELLLRSLHGRPSRGDVAGTVGGFCLCEWVEDHGTPAAILLATRPGPRPSTCGRGSRCAGWGFAHPFQKLFQNGGVVEFRVFGSEQQGQFLTIVSKVVQLFQSLSSFRTFEFLQVTLAKRGSLLWVGMKPFAQTIGGS